MASFQTVRARAEHRKGGADKLKALIPPKHDVWDSSTQARVASSAASTCGSAFSRQWEADFAFGSFRRTLHAEAAIKLLR